MIRVELPNRRCFVGRESRYWSVPRSLRELVSRSCRPKSIVAANVGMNREGHRSSDVDMGSRASVIQSQQGVKRADEAVTSEVVVVMG